VKGETVIPKKVLIIDDEVLIRKTTALLLKKARIDVITAGNGPEGIDLAEKQNPDLILLDIVMPEMSGWEVLSRGFGENPGDSFYGRRLLHVRGQGNAKRR
jgi:CheY-like chemotaxis protein